MIEMAGINFLKQVTDIFFKIKNHIFHMLCEERVKKRILMIQTLNLSEIDVMLNLIINVFGIPFKNLFPSI